MLKDTLLVELGTEELPPKSLKNLAITFYEQIKSQLENAELAFESIEWFATPRRLAVMVKSLDEKQADKEIEKRGPAFNVAFDQEGKASKAALGWARSNGIEVEQAERLKTDKGEWLLHRAIQQGKSIDDLVPDMVNQALAKLPIPKPMRWGSSRTQFIRPVHTLTLMYGSKIIIGEALGISSNNVLQGHRFHSHGLITLKSADDYQDTLREAKVMVDYQARKDLILSQTNKLATALDATALIDDELLDEVTSLVEWPVALVGSFDEDFLQVPAEPLIYSMKDHQKYFPVQAANGQLLNKFIFITNIESKDPEKVIFGNEKVIRPRLADAEFFFKTDKKTTLASRLASLENVLFQKQLGTLKEKSERIASLSEFLAQQIGEDATTAHRAGLLSKTDLMTDMVLEFPQVQGTMGKYYARHDGESEAVAQALEDQYRPRYSGDSLPLENIGCAVAIADKIDTLVGIFGINQAPKGDKDPFALRRAAIGLLRIIIEKSLAVDLATIIDKSIESYQDKLSNNDVRTQVLEFIAGRYRAFYLEQGIDVDVIQAVLTNPSSAPLDFDQRIKAVAHFKSLEASSTLAAANKRVGNILAKFTGELLPSFDITLASESQERALYESFDRVSAMIAPAIAARDYQVVLTELATLKGVIDAFFDNVMVMADDEAVKVNRLTLLSQIRGAFLNVADISLLQS